jgi:hypothetical protein
MRYVGFSRLIYEEISAADCRIMNMMLRKAPSIGSAIGTLKDVSKSPSRHLIVTKEKLTNENISKRR